jgi:hypothetical protein
VKLFPAHGSVFHSLLDVERSMLDVLSVLPWMLDIECWLLDIPFVLHSSLSEAGSNSIVYRLHVPIFNFCDLEYRTKKE